jgi:hypothetical protein
MVVVVVEEASYQSIIAGKLFWVSGRLQHHNGLIITIEKQRATEDVKTTMTSVSTWWDDLRAGGEVGGWGHMGS